MLAELLRAARKDTNIVDWPIGRNRCTATFSIESDAKRGERAVRTTVGAPKKLTFAVKARIVDGEDGRTYILELGRYGLISVMLGTMKYQHEVVNERDPRNSELLAMFA